jgi:HEAT repeat protein
MRSTACVALAERRHPQALDAAATLLADPEPSCRIGAIKALEALPSEGAKAVLKFKLLVRDREAEVVAENLRALLTVKPDEIAFGRQLMDDRDTQLASMAALAVGESRAAGAYEALSEAFETHLDPEFRANVLVAVAVLRDERCISLLCDVVRGRDHDMALRALEAGVPFAGDPEFRAQLREAVQSAADRLLAAAFDERYGSAAGPRRR